MTYTIPKFLFEKPIYDLVEAFVADGATSYSKLSSLDKDDIVCAIRKVLGPDAYSLLIDFENFENVMNSYCSFLKTANSEDAYEFMCDLRKGSHEVYAFDLDMLFDYVVELNTKLRSA